MPLTRQCKANFIPLMLINKLLSEKSMHFSSLNVCDKFLNMSENEREIQKHWLLTGEVQTTTLADNPRSGATATMHPRTGLHQLAAHKSPWVNFGTWS